VEKALALASATSLPIEREKREQVLEHIPLDAIGQLDKLERLFFAYPDDLTELLYEFVCSRPDAFGVCPPVRQPVEVACVANPACGSIDEK
jgi:hypothetical protein